jgi:polyisoprenoid-binding protein YceI
MSVYAPGLVALLTLATAGSLAADPQWRSEPDGSELAFSAGYEGEEIPGRFSRFGVSVTTDATTGEPTALAVEIDVASADMRDDEINRELAQPEWFAAAAFPTARFVAEDIRPVGQGYLATGRLQIKGVERPLEVPFAWRPEVDKAVLAGSVDLSRLAWQIGVGEWSSDASLADRVQVSFRIELFAVP